MTRNDISNVELWGLIHNEIRNLKLRLDKLNFLLIQLESKLKSGGPSQNN